ncbi:Ras GTPase [Coemansia biformis]|uniref:Ras GTPase n=1 Tax=Coemansia biformis TaxID=1286918 RepID=A0A9W8CZ28_9FUNG|nr:Ras GTPase [Coemansia biformis]
MSRLLFPEYKVVMLGSGGVGKSMLTTKYMNGNFSDEYDPTIEDSYRKQCTVDHLTCILEILDTAGQEEYAAMRDYQIRGGDCFVVVYSVADMQTLHEAETILKLIFRIKETENVPIVLVGNKCDLVEREVTTKEGTELARRARSGFYEASARENIRVEDVFTQCVRRIKRLRKEAGPRSAGIAEGQAGQFASHHLKQSKALAGTRSWIQRRKSTKDADAMAPTHQSLPEYYMSHHSPRPSPRQRSHTSPLSPAKRKTADASSPGLSKRRSTTRVSMRVQEQQQPSPPAKDVPDLSTIRVVPLGQQASSAPAAGGRPHTRHRTSHRRVRAASPHTAAKQPAERGVRSMTSSPAINTNKELPLPRRKQRMASSACPIL